MYTSKVYTRHWDGRFYIAFAKVNFMNLEYEGELYMCIEQVSLINDTKKLRKELKLPIKRQLRYMKHNQNGTYSEINVVDYFIVNTYQPSGTHSLSVMLENGEQIRIIAPFFCHMQKSTFVGDMMQEEDYYSE